MCCCTTYKYDLWNTGTHFLNKLLYIPFITKKSNLLKIFYNKIKPSILLSVITNLRLKVLILTLGK